MEFYKYHGAGNDFILIDNRSEEFDVGNVKKIKELCHRRFGAGADGIQLLENSDTAEFKMVYINSDGSVGSMCGNGGRCIVHFAHHILKIIKDPQNIVFEAVDGMHEAKISGDEVKLKMIDVNEIGERNGLPFLHSGTTPHHVQYVENLDSFPVVSEAHKIRAKDPDPKGINVNYVEPKDDALHVRCYERGVEDETWACGTGATCVAIASHHLGTIKDNFAKIKMPGGEVRIDFEKIGDKKYRNIWLTGPAVCVFKGETK